MNLFVSVVRTAGFFREACLGRLQVNDGSLVGSLTTAEFLRS
jgi:hypothetical protein